MLNWRSFIWYIFSHFRNQGRQNPKPRRTQKTLQTSQGRIIQASWSWYFAHGRNRKNESNLISIVIEHDPETHETIIITLKETCRIIKGVQACSCQSQKITDAQARRIKKEKYSPERYWKGKTLTKKTYQSKGCWNLSIRTRWCQVNEQNGCLCQGSYNQIKATWRKKERMGKLQNSRKEKRQNHGTLKTQKNQGTIRNRIT